MENFLYKKLCEACEAEGLNPTTWAKRNGLSTGTPTQLKLGVRPTLQTLRKLVMTWHDPKHGTNIAIAYLKDEIERMGFTLDTIEPLLKDSTPTPELDEDLKTVAEFMSHAPIRESIHEFAALLRQSEWSRYKSSRNLMRQAEESALIQRAKRKKKSAKSAS